MTERELTDGCQRGDNRARKVLYETYAGPMLSLCLRYVGGREEAEDLLHDGFLKVFAVIGRFEYRGEGSLAAWLRRLFTNAALTYLTERAARRESDVDELPDVVDEEENEPPDVPPEVVTRLIGELPQGYRMVLNLYLIEGWSHKEIAQRLGIGESTSASQYLRARAALKQKIIHYLNAQDA